MKVSLITLARGSHEALRRISLYYKSLDFGNIDWIVVDHASDPPLHIEGATVVRHDDKTPWILATLRNLGAKYSRGRFLMFIGADAWIGPDWLKFVRHRNDDFALFSRDYADLNEFGELSLLSGEWPNPFGGVIWVSRDVFDYLNGFDTRFDQILCEDSDFRNRYFDSYIGIDMYGQIRFPSIGIGPKIYCWPEKGDVRRPNFITDTPNDLVDRDRAARITNSSLRYYKVRMNDMGSGERYGNH